MSLNLDTYDKEEEDGGLTAMVAANLLLQVGDSDQRNEGVRGRTDGQLSSYSPIWNNEGFSRVSKRANYLR